MSFYFDLLVELLILSNNSTYQLSISVINHKYQTSITSHKIQDINLFIYQQLFLSNKAYKLNKHKISL